MVNPIFLRGKHDKILQMDVINLSYILTTKNKLPYLKISLGKLLQQKKNGEEILIADCESTDGTRKYLTELKESGKIDYLVSEPDYGESHALNKLLLAAQGKLIKVITDDDIFHYPSIDLHREFMLAHPEIDFLSSNGGFKNQIKTDEPRPLDYTNDYKRWMKNGTPFSFCGLSTMFRRSSLPLIGLWNPSFRRADMEFSLRLTAGKANIAWHTGYSYVNVSNPQSVSIVYTKKIKGETDRLNKFYLNQNPNQLIIEDLNILHAKIRSILRYGEKKERFLKEDFITEWPAITAKTEKWLEKINETQHEFLWKH